jgi:CPA1 family monovalent cation:H+ antiporter
METLALSLFFLLAVAASGILTRTLPLPLPLPLVQIGLGACIAAISDRGVELDPDVFFLLFLPPLLFLDGWRIPKRGLFRDKGTILALAVGLVIFNVLGVGLFVHWMIPTMTMPVSFALAAVLSPTDPIAVSAIAKRVPIPPRLLHILEGESLLNDASGLVCMRFAVAAAMTGTFSLTKAFGTFVWLAIGGVAVGVGVTWGVSFAKNWISRRFGEDSGSQILVSLLIPFGAYMLAEAIHASGILAAVAGGITMSYVEQNGQALASTRVRRAATWDLMQFSANGIIFVLLGEQLPEIANGATKLVHDTGRHRPIWLLVYVLGVMAALVLLRSFWVWASLHLALLRGKRTRASGTVRDWRMVGATSLAGVRGAITLAGVLTIPLMLPDGSPFPGRELAIFLAAATIIISLGIASVGLPYLLRGLDVPPEPSYQEAEDRARVAAAQAAIQAIEQALHVRKVDFSESDADLYTEAGARLMELYRQRIDGQSKHGEEAARIRKTDEIERRLRLVALSAERDEIYHIARNRSLPDDTTRKLVRELDLQETRLTAN